ncbi:MAG: cryptochrome/photolyase family protein [Pirellulales bacterium]|nr:cryptochrome/photolyase family protein [Pirellulales bacterium]
MLAALIYPHQLYARQPALAGADLCVLVEDPLFFRQYPFHAQKLVLHRASLRHYADTLRQSGHIVEIIPCDQLAATGDLALLLKKRGVTTAQLLNPCDDWLEQRLTTALAAVGIACRLLPDPHFLTSREEFATFAQPSSSSRTPRKRLFFTEFYITQRRRLGVLLDKKGTPVGGKWSFDTENRRKLPRGMTIPEMPVQAATPHVRAAQAELAKQFPQAPGRWLDFAYPVTAQQAQAGLRDFLDQRFANFGEYEDAIHSTEPFLFHSVLTPALNIGLLTPKEVLDAALARLDDVPLNSLEGFIRQIIGWREYMRGVYLLYGRRQRTRNYWEHTRPLPAAFYDGTTGIEPVDMVIQRVLRHAYCHHIERLMILGNFMLLCEIDPDAIYQWFMELFIDAYDWVMVPNIYGMSQHADGGLITTKPYLSGSSYVLKMSNFKKGVWCPIWDALYWRFIHKHRNFFNANPRMSVMSSQLDKMGPKLANHLRVADEYLARLHHRVT